MRSARRRAAAVAVTTLASAVAACGGGAKPSATGTPTVAATAAAAAAKPTTAPPKIAIARQDLPACAGLFARLQRVTVALSSSSELIAQSVDKNDLSRRIETEQQQLERSARLMDAAVVPLPLAAANRRLVAALRAFARDFARAKSPAQHGDLPGAVAAMTDQGAVNRVLSAAKAIEDACSGY
jgi:hypothetical protein